MVLFFAVGAFMMMASHYIRRLHQLNVQSGAVGRDGRPVEMPRMTETTKKSNVRKGQQGA